ncbi:TetR/AcrR family transcriptional regulator [Sinosporangium siamense]|uniref:Tetracycline repressor, C-all-alpha domain protein n=1 Tax=Sinosporangium siamense TaxID=1367973 RepID=A0A919V702_9ACTN|nr:TetR/AcrR family transcriptional regulator C-terminal domain-containing protein [Sinosporangium siamense]GII94605.1 tetracycline repressor, C-all-alpha domain protein [Sinosporangium siamense]
MTRRVGRPVKPVLTREVITRAALTLIRESGAEGFSLAALGQKLGVRPSSFYNHVTGRDDILAGVRELVTHSIDATMFSRLPWDEAVVRWAHGYRTAFAAHPTTITLLATLPVTGALRTLRMYDQVASGLERGGWPTPMVIPVVVAVESFILGSALDVVAPPDMFDSGPLACEVPTFAVAVHARDAAARERGVSPADLAFEIGLHSLVAGLRVTLASQTG